MNAPATLYRYRAARTDGRVVRGSLSARDTLAAARRIEADGLMVLDIRAVEGSPVRGRTRRQDLAIVFRHVALLVADGVPVERALETSEALVRGRLAHALEDLRALVREGHSVSAGMDALGQAFPRSLVGIVRAGEGGSRLAEAFQTAADQLEEDVRLRSEVRSALAYPLLILVVGVASIAIMGGVVVPRFAQVLSDLGAVLPPTTRWLLAGSEFLQRFGIPVALAAALLAAVAVRWARSPSGRQHLDPMLLAVPVVGGIRLGLSTARTCRALGGMLGTGMPLLAALDATQDATGDVEVSRRLARARASVARGRRLTDALSEARVLAPLALQLVGVGESSGRLGMMLTRAGDVVAERTQRTLRALVKLIEPLLVIVLGTFVAGVSAALLQAVYSVRP